MVKGISISEVGEEDKHERRLRRISKRGDGEEGGQKPGGGDEQDRSLVVRMNRTEAWW
jgi:hypothetical protein